MRRGPVDWVAKSLLDKLLKLKEKDMKHVFTREISADFQDLTDAGCMVLYKDDGRELFRVVVWPKDKIDPTVSPRTQSLCVNKFLVRYVEGGIHPVALEVLLASLQVPYTVRAYDPSKEKGGEPELSPAQQGIRDRKAAKKLGKPNVTRVLTVTVNNLEAAGFNTASTSNFTSIKVWLKDTPHTTVCAEQSLVDELGCHLTFTFTGQPTPFERELAKYRVSHTVVRDVDYPKPEPVIEPVARVELPRRSITAQLRALQSIKGIRFSGNMDQPGWRVTIPDLEGKPQTFISQASDEMTCIEVASADLSLLEELLHFHRVPYQVGYPVTQISNCIRKAQVASIQVAATRQSDNGFEVVGENDLGRTHWSVYLRDEEGLVTHVEDYKISGFGGPACADALQHAAGLSIQHQVPIEPIP